MIEVSTIKGKPSTFLREHGISRDPATLRRLAEQARKQADAIGFEARVAQGQTPGERLRLARELRGLKADDPANQGVPWMAVQSAEHDLLIPAEQLARLIEILNVPMDLIRPARLEGRRIGNQAWTPIWRPD